MIKLDMLGPAEFRYGDLILGFRPLEKLVHIALQVAGGARGMAELAEDVWVVPTSGSASTLRGCLSKTRAKLVAAGGGAEELTRTVRLSGGRTIVTTPGQWDVDADRFRDGAAAAHTAYDAGQFDEARSLADATLKLWYDDPLPDADGRPFALRYIEELKAIHWAATITRIKAGICAGWHRELIAELRHLAEDRPGEGEIAMLLATALYRSDMAPEAAEVCQRAIADRAGQGTEAHRLQDLQHAILTERAPLRGPLRWQPATYRPAPRQPAPAAGR
jgi:DNA-binding SARP family transcriptional activator